MQIFRFKEFFSKEMEKFLSQSKVSRKFSIPKSDVLSFDIKSENIFFSENILLRNRLDSILTAQLHFRLDDP